MAWNTSGWGNWIGSQCYAISMASENLIDSKPSTNDITSCAERNVAVRVMAQRRETPAGTRAGAAQDKV